MKLSRLFAALAGVARLQEDPELRAKFLQLARTQGRTAALAWLDAHAHDVGLPSEVVQRLREELTR